MSTITTRAGKGSPLTNTELDLNFTNLNTDKYQSGDNASFGTLAYTGTLTGSTGIINIGSGQIYKDASGNVGIGTASPGYKLEVTDFAYVTGAGGKAWQARDTTASVTVGFGVNSTGGYMFTSQSVPLFFSTTGTERMRIDSSGNVGIGTSSPVGRLGVVNTGGNSRLSIGDTAANTYSTLTMFGGSGKYNFQLGVQNNVGDSFEITPSTAAGGTTFSTPALVVNSSGRVGIGTTSPASGYILAVGAGTASTNSAMALDGGSDSNFGSGIAFRRNGVSKGFIGTQSWVVSGTSDDITLYASASGALRFYSNGAQNAILDTSGNLGLGVTPSAWATFKAQQIGVNAANLSLSSAGDYGVVGNNIYYNAGWLSSITGYKPSAHMQVAGAHQWFTSATNGTAGSAVTWSQAMTLDASGNLGIGTTSTGFASSKLIVDGNIQTTWNARRVAAVYDNSYRQGMYFDVTARNLNIFSTTNDSGGNILFNTSVGAGGSDANYGSERMRILADGRVSIGTSSPNSSVRLTVSGGYGEFLSGASGSVASLSVGRTAPEVTLGVVAVGGNYFGGSVAGDTALAFGTGNLLIGSGNIGVPGTEFMRITSSGNVGIGVAPSAWGGFRATQIGSTMSLWSPPSGNGSAFYSQNLYYNGANRIALTTGTAVEYIQDLNGNHIWFNAASATAGNALTMTERMRIDSSGNVGIGGTPFSKLDVNGTATVRGSIDVTLAAGGHQITLNSTAGGYSPIGINNGTSQIAMTCNGATTEIRTITNHPQIFMTNNTERMRIDSSGNVSIGTTGVSTVRTFIKGSTADNTAWSLYIDNSASSNIFAVRNDGNVGIGTASPTRKLDVYSAANNVIACRSGDTAYFSAAGSGRTPLTDSFDFIQDATLGYIYQRANLPIVFGTNNTERMRMTAGGDVGIGTASPGYTATNRKVLAINGGTGGGEGAILAFMQGGTNKGYLFSIGNDMELWCESGQLAIGNNVASPVVFKTNNSERMRVSGDGYFLVGTTSAPYSAHQINNGTTAGVTALVVGAGAAGIGFFVNNTDQNNYSATACAFGGGRASGSGRSINVGGTVNASGADYAEYMVKAGDFTIAKGDVVGVDSNGKLTNVFADAVSFVVKSTDPSYVGGDVWGTVDVIGARPSDDATQEEKDDFEARLEAARQAVDRIAFAGQVPVNVLGATPGQYIVPINDNGTIKGQAVSSPTFEQYQIAVGKVIAIESDGRAKIIVKVA